jgi:hypothetical protein
MPEQFYRVMHEGIGQNGELLYPAMPFQDYTKVTRADSDAIFAYLKSVPPVNQPARFTGRWRRSSMTACNI